jgi:hypothetical protein
MRHILTVLAIIFPICASTAPALAIKFPKIHAHVDLHQPLNPVQVTIGHTTIGPSVAALPPIVRVDGNGPIPNLINKANRILQTPATVAVNVVTWPIREIQSLKNGISGAISGAEKKINDWLGELEAAIPTVIVWIVAGIFALITLAVITGELLTHLLVSLFGGTARRRRARRPLKSLKRT